MTPIRAPSFDAPKLPVAGLPMKVRVGVPPPNPNGAVPMYTQRCPGAALGFAALRGIPLTIRSIRSERGNR